MGTAQPAPLPSFSDNMRRTPAIALPLLLLTACGAPEAQRTTPPGADSAVVNVYTHRHYDTDKQLFARFTQETGIRVNVISAGDDELLSRLEAEGANTPADLVITADAGRLGLAKQRGFLKPVKSAVLDANVPAHLRDPEGNWYGFTMRARVIAYDKTKVKPEEVRTYDDLTKPRFKGKVLARSSENVYNQSLVAAMIAHDGPEKTTAWCKGVVANFARDPKGSDTDQLLAIGEGLGEVAIANSYYIGKLLTSDDPARQKAKGLIGVSFPDLSGHGTHVNVSGAGVVKYTKNEANAVKLLEFLSSDEAQRLFAEGNMEFPAKPGVPVAAVLQGFGPFTADTLDLSQLGLHNADAVKVLGAAGWR
ncbi:MAG: Fe(3+) ABC transporter substrate-binding protein [Bacteroidetes bacterium]|nr:Fe(3+) ABC transporter substrate-binding protein [Bacteroidota bacterium]